MSGFGASPFGSSPFGSQSAAVVPDVDPVVEGGVCVILAVDSVVHIISPTRDWRWTMDRHADRVAGSNLLPFTVLVKTANQRPFDLTGSTALFTLVREGATAPAVDSKANTNTPGPDGAFEYSPTLEEMSEDGEYRLTVVMSILGKQRVDRFGVQILPAF